MGSCFWQDPDVRWSSLRRSTLPLVRESRHRDRRNGHCYWVLLLMTCAAGEASRSVLVLLRCPDKRIRLRLAVSACAAVAAPQRPIGVEMAKLIYAAIASLDPQRCRGRPESTHAPRAPRWHCSRPTRSAGPRHRRPPESARVHSVSAPPGLVRSLGRGGTRRRTPRRARDSSRSAQARTLGYSRPLASAAR